MSNSKLQVLSNFDKKVLKKTNVIVNPLPETSKFVYKDLFNQLKEEIDINNKKKRDIKSSLNAEAIKNSLNNLFNTTPGEHLFLPDFGIDLRKHLFEPITQFRAKLLADDIIKQIDKYEPRVYVEKIFVQPNPDESEYYILMILRFPKIDNNPISIESVVSQSGFNFY